MTSARAGELRTECHVCFFFCFKFQCSMACKIYVTSRVGGKWHGLKYHTPNSLALLVLVEKMEIAKREISCQLVIFVSSLESVMGSTTTEYSDTTPRLNWIIGQEQSKAITGRSVSPREAFTDSGTPHDCTQVGTTQRCDPLLRSWETVSM